MATVSNRSIGFSIFLILKFLVADQLALTNVHCHTNFIKIGEMVGEITHLTIFKMAAVWILKNLIF